MIMPAASSFIRYTCFPEKLGVISNFANVRKLSASVGNGSPCQGRNGYNYIRAEEKDQFYQAHQ